MTAALGVASCHRANQDAATGADPQPAASASAVATATEVVASPAASVSATASAATTATTATTAGMGLVGLGVGGPRVAHASCGAVARRDAPRAFVTTHLEGAGGPQDEAAIARLKPGLRACADKALLNDPTQQGTVVLRASIGADGVVGSVAVVTSSGIATACASCMQSRVRRASFAPGAARNVTFAVVQTRVTE